MQRFVEYKKAVLDNCGKVIKGKSDVIEKVLISFLCSGHVLLEDVPGTGKTMLLRAFAKTVGGSFKRVQFTPDLLPSDLTGINFYNQATGQFQFRPGPIFANMVLADEINRTTPRTQSSLLEAMAEHQVTVDGDTYPMAEPFMIMATQNSVESYGTFPLPEAQTDRFFMRLSLGYMQREDELLVLRSDDTVSIVEQLTQQVTDEQTQQLKEAVKSVSVSDDIMGYIMDIVEATRNHKHIRIGVSTRGALALYKASQAAAALSGRNYVTPQDVKMLAPCILAHRLTMSASIRRGEDETLIREILDNVKVPLED